MPLVWQYDWNWSNAEHEFRRSLDLSPNNLDGHETFAWFLSWSGRRDEALAEITKMRELDPAFPLRCQDRAGLYYHLREYPELLKAGQEAVDLNPSEWTAHYFLASGYFGLGKAEAISEYQGPWILGSRQRPAAALAFAYTTVGRRADAQKILTELQQQSSTAYVSPYMIATIFAGLGDKTRAFGYLQKSYDEKSPDLAYFIKADFRLDSLRSDPRFAELVHRLALPQ